MVAACDDELGIRHPVRQQIESLHHQLKPLIGSPLAESENALIGISATGKIGELGTARENSVRPQMHIVAPVFIVQYFSISRHEHGYGVR